MIVLAGAAASVATLGAAAGATVNWPFEAGWPNSATDASNTDDTTTVQKNAIRRVESDCFTMVSFEEDWLFEHCFEHNASVFLKGRLTGC